MKDGVGISALNERLRTIAMPCATARPVLLRPNGINSMDPRINHYNAMMYNNDGDTVDEAMLKVRW